MKICLSICLALITIFSGMGITAVNGSTIYTGSLSTTDGGLSGTGSWISGSSLGWTVTQVGPVWHYEYNLIVPAQDISHLIIEVSPNFTTEDAFNTTGAFNSIEIGDFSSANGNPGMPGSVHGIKFDETSGMNLTIEFDSHRVPIWGDFYSKDGKTPGGTYNAVWNSGFVIDDPLVPAHDGAEANHLLVPDTVTPEPSTIIILITGLIASGLYRLCCK